MPDFLKKKHRYIIDLDGKDFCYKNTKPSYKEGEKVTLYYYMIATDTDYSFTVDGQAFSPDYETGRGFIFRFVMPSHDVKIECFSRNSMLRIESEESV